MNGESVLDTSAPYGEDVGGRLKEVRFCNLAKFPDLLPDHPTSVDEVVGGGQRDWYGGLDNAVLEVRRHRVPCSKIVPAPSIEQQRSMILDGPVLV